MGKPKGKSKKLPTLDELEENERWGRFYMECRIADACDLPGLPPIDADQDEIECVVGEIEDAIQEAKNLICDGEEWIKAFLALREAKTKLKEAA
jgi:hypothetical protein